MASGAGTGLALGLLIIGFREYRDSSFRREEEVHQALRLPVFALIPLIRSDREQRAARVRTLAMDVAGSTFLVAVGVVLVFWRVQL
jgi:hypothetical protein